MKLGPLYVIADTSVQSNFSPDTLVRAALAGGADVIQLRAKGWASSSAGWAAPESPMVTGSCGSTRALIEIARECGALCRRARVPFLVNDRVDIAWAADADGVHLGDDDMPLAPARALLGPHRILGASADNIEQILARVSEGADYCGIGPVFPTSTKRDAGPVLGLEELARAVKASPVPLVAIGGITMERIPEVAATGVYAIALVSAVCAADDPEDATRRARELWLRATERPA